MDEEIMMGRNLYLHGELEEKTEPESWTDQNQGPSLSALVDYENSPDLDDGSFPDDF